MHRYLTCADRVPAEICLPCEAEGGASCQSSPKHVILRSFRRRISTPQRTPPQPVILKEGRLKDLPIPMLPHYCHSEGGTTEESY